jgi:Fuc2NAc and GlcNAc transferase
MDGIDGIALQEAVFIAAGGFVLLWEAGSPWNAPLFILAISSMTTLWWNWAPARIFLGDVGSGFLGFVLATIAIDSAMDSALPFATWLILWGVFVCDSGVTLVTRLLTGQRWYAAHSSHAYQHLARRFRSHAMVSGGILVLNIVWLFPWAWISTSGVLSPGSCLAVSLGPLAVAAYLLGAGKPTRSIVTGARKN